MEGWVKLHRKLLESPVFQNEKLLKVFVWCLLKASHTEHAELVGLQKVSLHPGQFVYGRHKAAEELKIKESTLYKYMMWLKNEEILNIQSNNKFSVVTVVNWELYQIDEPKSNSKSNSKGTTKEQQRNTNKNDKNDKNDKKNIPVAVCNEQAKKLNDWAVPFFHEKYLGQKSLEVFDKLTRIDGYQPEEIQKAIEWARADDFWSSNFLSPVKLRNKDKNGVKYIDVFLAKLVKNGTNRRYNKEATSLDQLAEILKHSFEEG